MRDDKLHGLKSGLSRRTASPLPGARDVQMPPVKRKMILARPCFRIWMTTVGCPVVAASLRLLLYRAASPSEMHMIGIRTRADAMPGYQCGEHHGPAHGKTPWSSCWPGCCTSTLETGVLSRGYEEREKTRQRWSPRPLRSSWGGGRGTTRPQWRSLPGVPLSSRGRSHAGKVGVERLQRTSHTGCRISAPAAGQDMDIVLLDAGSPFGYGFLLPRGGIASRLGLRRADVGMTSTEEEATPPRRTSRRSPVFSAREGGCSRKSPANVTPPLPIWRGKRLSRHRYSAARQLPRILEPLCAGIASFLPFRTITCTLLGRGGYQTVGAIPAPGFS
jgi:hypothetical protein